MPSYFGFNPDRKSQAPIKKTEGNPLALSPTEQIKSLYLGAIGKHFSNDDPLKSYLLKYYSNDEILKDQYLISTEGLNNEEIKAKLGKLASLLENKTLFIEDMYRLKEKNDILERLENREKNNPNPDKEELEAGVYREELESQVRDAVFTLTQKGYKTFESGFYEGRSQYMGMHNKNIKISKDFLDFLKEQSFDVSINNMEDRTMIVLSPTKETVVTLDEWKSVWDGFASKMPEVEKITIYEKEEVEAHKEFRNKHYKI